MKRFFICLFCALFSGLCASAWAGTDVVCVYYPHWHRYAKGDEWFGAEKWREGEWCFVKDAKARFSGQKQPMVPFAGYLDESNPKDMATDIALAANAGIDVFLYDYYYYNGAVTQEAALEKGFLGAVNCNRLKFALMWCYHERSDQFRPVLGQERRRLMSLAHTKEEFLGLIDLAIKRYFPRPEYWRKDGKLFFSLYNFRGFFERHGGSVERVRAEFEEARARVRAAGLGELHLNVQIVRPQDLACVAACGVDSAMDYVYTVTDLLPGKTTEAMRAAGVWEADYARAIPSVLERWNAMANGPVQYFPQAPVGWDSTPRCRLEEPYPWRCHEYPYTMTFTGNTPDAFRQLLVHAKAFAERNAKGSGVVYVNGWNEYTEGTYLVPNNFDADGFLRAIASVFGRTPADEYTFVDPSTRTLMTIPAATYETLSYGPHAQQKLDVWLPKGAKGLLPMVVYTPRGWESSGLIVDKCIGERLKTLLERGTAVACVSARTPDDRTAALAYLKSRSSAWRVDASRLSFLED